MPAKQAILIMVDTQRRDMLSCYDRDGVPTPNLDGLAAEGRLYENAFTCQPVCGPARSSIFTGLYPHGSGVTANSMQLGANVKNAGQWLSPQGVKCGYVGKWHLDGGDYFGYGRCPDGYIPEYWYDMRNFLDGLTEKERSLSRRNMGLRTDDPKEEDTYAHKCVNRALDFINNYRDEDFFLTLSLDEPHDPSVCPRRFFKILDERRFKIKKTPNVSASLKNKPEQQRVWAKAYRFLNFPLVQKSMRALYACNAFCDYEIGRFLDGIRELKIEPLLIYTADHGDMMLSHSLMGKGCAMYNEIVRIPLLISGGGFEKGRDTAPVSHIDLLPTVMTYFGKKAPAMLHGEPLQNVRPDAPRDVFIEYSRYEVDHDGFMGYQPIRCITDGRYKLAVNLLTSDEFYDLTADPWEMTNLIDTKDKRLRKIRDAMHDRLLRNMNVTRDAYRGYYWAARPWRPSKKPSFRGDGCTRQLVEEDFTQLDYSTGLPMKSATRKKL